MRDFLSIEYRKYLINTLETLGFKIKLNKRKWLVTSPKERIKEGLLVFSTKTNIPSLLPRISRRHIKAIPLGKRYSSLRKRELLESINQLLTSINLKNYVNKGQRISR